MWRNLCGDARADSAPERNPGTTGRMRHGRHRCLPLSKDLGVRTGPVRVYPCRSSSELGKWLISPSIE